MTNIQIALFFDAIILCMCSFLVLHYGRLAHSHPATIYLFYHIYTVTIRLIGISLGTPTLFQTWLGNYSAVTHHEIIRAAITYDIALIMMTIAWIRGSIDDEKKNRVSIEEYRKKLSNLALVQKLVLIKAARGNRKEANKQDQFAANKESTLSLRHIWRVVGITFPIGLIGLITLSRFSGKESAATYLDVWQSSSWIIITQQWAGLAILALIYWYGFRFWLMVPMVCYLFVQSLQGEGRFRVIIPVILLCQIYLDRNKLKWPSKPLLILLASFALLFYPLKSIGQLAQRGAGPDEILNSSTAIISSALAGKHDDQQFLDMYASGLTLIDASGKFYYGRTYLTLLTLPIPRQVWSDKPGLGDYIYNFATAKRPMGDAGMTVTYLGESYANFGYVGILIIPYLLAYGLSRVYFYAYRSKYLSVTRFTYLILACNLIQVYRDSLVSIVVFTFVNMMPLMIIMLLHYLLPVKRIQSLRQDLGVSLTAYLQDNSRKKNASTAN